MQTKSSDIFFSDLQRRAWLSKIQEIFVCYSDTDGSDKSIVMCFDKKIVPSDFEPLHLVTLACIIHFLISLGYKVKLSRYNEEIFDYIFNDLGFNEYWSGNKNHIDARKSDNIFNLWRILETEKEIYAKHIEQYLKNNYFQGKDTSIISLSLTEAFYNVFDHAKANGNAFLILKYDRDRNRLYVAIADFGVGIPTSVRRFDPSFKSDKDALEASIADNFTVRSTTHNKGMGLGIILACASEARIFSNHAIAIKKSDHIYYRDPEIYFPGTLIYFEVDISTFEDEEIIDTFSW